MNPLIIVAIVAAGLAATVNWYAVARADLHLERVSKAAVIVPLLVAVLLNDPDASPTSLLLGAALVASLAGDWLLLPPERFAAGLVAFLVAHLAYLGVFLVGPLELGLAGLGFVVASALLLGAGRTILTGARRAHMGRPVAAYFIAICLMAIAATASGSPVAAAGAWLFVVSDALLGWARFVAPSTTSPARTTRRLSVLIPYHLAQILLTAAILINRTP